MMKKKQAIKRIPLIAALFLIFLIGCSEENATDKMAPAAGDDDRIVVDLNERPAGFGSAGQASELLSIIQKNPGKNFYKIIYKTEEDKVEMFCDLNRRMLVRTHTRKDGTGTQDVWTGYILDRIKICAAGAGTLNDTPVGEKLGTFTSF